MSVPSSATARAPKNSSPFVRDVLVTPKLTASRPVCHILVLSCLAGLACGREPSPPALFELLPMDRTGVSFTNELPEDTSFNILNYLYYYNGGGVAAGDVNGDGLPDLYFTSNLDSDRLYLNRGDYRFEDVTGRAGVQGPPGWTTGVTMADVNGDGHLDIYVSAVSYLSKRGHNILYVNDGDGTFTDRTAEYGLDFSGYSTQALFFDYDLDGDLDMYLLNYSVHEERGPSSSPQRFPRHPRAGDRLYRNDGKRFTDVSDRAGIYGGVEGYGLGVVASDFDSDGCIDLFVANDFQENDFLYRNNCDGTFRESIGSAMGHTSRFSMGVDAADFNNDGRPDLAVLDMFPQREEIVKTSANAEQMGVFDLKTKAGYHPQYARNTLQLNRGGGRFSDIGYLAGVYATDWSWSALFADLDNDGRKDLFVTNGIWRRPNDLDYIDFVGREAVQRSLARGIDKANLALIGRMPHVAQPNVAFRNDGDLTFTNVAREWGLGTPGFSNGAVYADLNNSGALDLVINNVNAPASIYRNRAREAAGGGAHYLRVALRGARANTAGIGARVIVRHGGTTQMLEQAPTRGFQSSVDPRLHFGLGAARRVDSLIVVWPGGASEVRTNVPADTAITLAERDARGRYAAPAAPAPLFTMDTAPRGLDYRHRENDAYDFNREPFMPHMLSREGPAFAVADVNGDGLDDLYAGGAKRQAGEVYLQTPDGGFRATRSGAIRADSLAEDVDATFFDADGDGDADLYVVSGGNEFWGEQEALRDRLYLNDGRGGFSRARDALPAIFENGACVAAADWDGDGDMDLFVGSRVRAREYGRPPASHLLENDGHGRFRDVTAQVAPALSAPGMVTSAAWTDLDGDHRLDLVVVGEWMPVRVFSNRGGANGALRLEERTADWGLAGTEGWWNSVTAADLDGDGHPDLVIGNLGLNSYIKASPREPARLYVHDFGNTGALKQILTFYKDGVSYPIATRDEIVKQIPSLRAKYPTHASYGASRVEDIFPAEELKAATVLEARTFESVVAMNDGTGRFVLRPLPADAQFAPVYASLARDFDGDGRVDLLLGGNFSGVTPLRGKYDASYGLLLRGDASGRFAPVDLPVSGVAIPGEIRALGVLRTRGGAVVAAARNDDTIVLLKKNSPATPTKRGSR